MISTLWLYPILLVGAGAAGTFLVMHRPRRWWRFEAIDAAGWVWLLFIIYAQRLVLLILSPAAVFPSGTSAVVALLFGALIDALLVLRVVSFVRFKRTEKQQDRDS